MSDHSWRLKLYRAEKHFDDLKGTLGLPIRCHEYPVSEVFNADGEYDYRLALPDHPLNEDIPLIAGDILFNIRSGLDHLLAACIPDNDKERAQFSEQGTMLNLRHIEVTSGGTA